MSNIIGRLRIELPGRQMRSEQECSEQLTDNSGKVVTRPISDMNDYKPMELKVKVKDKKTHKEFFTKETLHVYTRKCVPAIQSMPITEDFYRGCIDTPVGTMSRNQWKKIAANIRLKMHMEQIANDLNGKLVDYTVFE